MKGVNKIKVELFTAGCRLCNEAQFKYSDRFPQWDLEVHRAEECTDGSCCMQAAKYDISAVPALVINGEVMQVGNPTEQDLLRLESMV